MNLQLIFGVSGGSTASFSTKRGQMFPFYWRVSTSNRQTSVKCTLPNPNPNPASQRMNPSDSEHLSSSATFRTNLASLAQTTAKSLICCPVTNRITVVCNVHNASCSAVLTDLKAWTCPRKRERGVRSESVRRFPGNSLAPVGLKQQCSWVNSFSNAPQQPPWLSFCLFFLSTPTGRAES